MSAAPVHPPEELERERLLEDDGSGLPSSSGRALGTSAQAGGTSEGERAEELPRTARRGQSFLWLPLALVIITTGLLYLAKPGGVAESPVILTTLNALFVVATSLAVAYLAARTYLKTAERAMLALGCAALSLGVIYLLAGPLVGSDLDAALVLHNGGLLLTAALFVVGAVWSVTDGTSQDGRSGGPTWIWLSYAGTVAVLGLLTWAALAGVTPAFFVPGHGVTALRNAVLGSAAGGFVIAAIVLRLSYRKTRSRFLGWYSIGLAMFAIGLGTVWLGEPGSAISWLGRAAQCAAGVYMLVAILAAVEESGSWSITLSGALRESESRFRSLFESMTEGVALHELIYDGAGAVDYRLLDVNPSFARQTGMEAELARDRLASDLYGTAEAPYLREYARVAETGEHCSFETYFEPLKRHFSITAVALGGARFATIFEDVTERRRAAKALRDSEERLNLALSAGGIAAWDYRIDTGEIVWNQEHYRMMGYEPGEVESSYDAFLARVHPDDAARVDALFLDSLKRAGDYNAEFRALLPGGEIRWIVASGGIDVDAAGDPRRSYGVMFDVTERHAAEEALRAGEERFRLVLGAAPVTVAAQDTELRYVWAFGQRTAPPGGVIGKTDADIFTPQEADHLREIKQRVLDEGVEVREQLWLDRPQGRIFLDTTTTPLRDEKGVVIGLGISTVDLTQMRLAEDALMRHAEMLDLSHDAIIVWQLGGTIESWNRGAEELYGFSQEEALGRVSHDLLCTIHERPLQVIEETLREHGSWDGEVRHHAKDGRVVVVMSRHQLIRGGDGIERVIETNRDITESKDAEEALRRSDARLRRFYEAGLVGVIFWNTDGEILDANDCFLDMVGYTREELAAGEIDWIHMTPPEFAYLDERALAEMEADGVNSVPFEKEYLRKDGTRVPIILAGAMLDDERREGVAFVLDISDRKRAEEVIRTAEAERVAQQERSRLARDLHDSVTQALFAATLKTEALTLADESLPDGVFQVAEEVRRLNRGALAQMRTLLLELRGEPLEDVPLGQLLRHLVEAAEGRSSVNVQLTIRGGERLPPTLNAPIYRITQEALNNVTRHAKASTARVDLDVAHGAVHLVVGDDGCGFDPSAQDPSQLGLRSMRERAEEAGARFDLATELGGGTVITVDWQTD